jgi:hypothetical protein
MARMSKRLPPWLLVIGFFTLWELVCIERRRK